VTAQCPNCAFALSRRERIRARFRTVACAHCGTPVRANVRSFIVFFYTGLTVLMYLCFWWTPRVGCLLPFALFVAVWIAGEMLAGLVSPVERELRR
jgi:endogenous inhibitor of DNA gyrase (YacG/DUF329 family)